MKKLLLFLIILLVILLGILTASYFAQNPTVLNSNNISNQLENTLDASTEYENNVNDLSSNIEPEEKRPEDDLYSGIFELPINGTTAFASVSLPLYRNNSMDGVLLTLSPGKAFKILEESSGFFYVELSDSTKGWVEGKYCLVNLPDLIPSIIYDDTNSYKSLFRSSGYELENITGRALYDVKKYNNRLQKNEYIMPLLYPMIEKIAQVQKEALKNGDCLKIYETYRPYDVQMKVSDSLGRLMESNEEVNAGIMTTPWNKGWFIATQLSNHQRGVALDVSLVKVKNTEYKYCGSYSYLTVTKYEEYKMPTKMHELSVAAATFVTPVSSKSTIAWQNAQLAPTMTDGAKKLQNYFTSFGLTPLASEWWHFNDLETRELTKDKGSTGRYYLTQCLSEIPTNFS